MSGVLITGVTGFTGGYLARRLLKDGQKVRGLALPGTETAELEALGMETVRGDLRDPDTLLTAVRGVGTVYHVAAVYREENIPKKTFWEVNVTGTGNLLEASLSSGVGRFVHCSTVGVQGHISHPPAKEDAPYHPGDYYQQSKMEGELLALDYYRRGLPVVIFRPVGIYGPGDTRFLKFFRYIQSGRFRMFGSGEVLYHLTYIDDLIDGIVLTGTVPGIEGEIFNLAGPEYTTLNEWARIVAGVLGVELSSRHLPVWPLWLAGAACEFICRPFRIPPPVYRRRVDFFIKDRAFDTGKARERLGYDPKVDLRTGLGRTAEWYQKTGLLK